MGTDWQNTEMEKNDATDATEWANEVRLRPSKKFLLPFHLLLQQVEE